MIALVKLLQPRNIKIPVWILWITLITRMPSLTGQTILNKLVISNGGQSSSNLNYRTNLTIGQSFAAKLQQANTQACVGFWYLPKEMSTSTLEIEKNSVLDPVFALKLFPNPFQSKTTAEFQVGAKGRVRLFWVDMQGNLVSNLLDEVLTPGKYRVILKADGLVNAMYTLVLTTEQQRLHQKAIVLN